MTDRDVEIPECLRKPEGKTCSDCCRRPATAWYVGAIDPGLATWALAHGEAWALCEVCLAQKQVQNCRDAAERLAEAEERLASVLRAEEKAEALKEEREEILRLVAKLERDQQGLVDNGFVNRAYLDACRDVADAIKARVTG
jgi:hypothetical protein